MRIVFFFTELYQLKSKPQIIPLTMEIEMQTTGPNADDTIFKLALGVCIMCFVKGNKVDFI